MGAEWEEIEWVQRQDILLNAALGGWVNVYGGRNLNECSDKTMGGCGGRTLNDCGRRRVVVCDGRRVVGCDGRSLGVMEAWVVVVAGHFG